MSNSEEITNKKINSSALNNSNYSTITEYLEKLLFPTLSLSISKVPIFHLQCLANLSYSRY